MLVYFWNHKKLKQASMATQPSHTCITCRVAFRDAEIQRAHYKTDWHRYNLKRKVAELPPVSAESFQDKVLSQREATGAANESKHEVCEVCRKHFTSRNSYESHLRSRKHREAAALCARNKVKDDACKDMNQTVEGPKEEAVSGTEETREGSTRGGGDCEPEPLEITECLFCPHQSIDMEQNLTHMSKTHGFFIPELDYLVDVKGLIEYLCEKVGVGNMCLYCNDKGKTFHSVESVQQHMVDKCHCKLFFEGDAALEYAEYFDYSKSYPDCQESGEFKGGSSPDDVSQAALPDTSMDVNDSLELVLPSGAKVGHRALKLYYKQHLPSQEQRKSALVSRLVSQYRALGWKETGRGESGMLRQRGEAWGKRMQKARDMRLGVKANKLQHHFRPQVVF